MIMQKGKLSFCREIRYLEFPDMLFGSDEKKILYFDADRYITAKGDPAIHSVEDFKSKFDFWLKAISETYRLSPADLFAVDKASGNRLMEESLSLLFIAYLDPCFAAYMLERISEMLVTGIALSDTSLLRMANERGIKEDLM
jgi:hypothetical protein